MGVAGMPQGSSAPGSGEHVLLLGGKTLSTTAHYVDARPEKEVTDADLRFLKSLRPEAALTDLKAQALRNFAEFMNSGGLKYRCFQNMYHLLPAITSHFQYADILLKAPDSFLIELGGGQGTDARKLVQDGWPAEQILVSDVDTFLRDVGLDLFQDGPDGPCQFLLANVLSDTDMGRGGALYNFLQAADIAYSMFVLHLFNEPTVTEYMRRASDLLKPGGLFIGATLAAETPGLWGIAADPSQSPWLHSPATFRAALQDAGYEKIRLETCLFDEFLRRRGFGQPICDIDSMDFLGIGRNCMVIWFSATKPASPAS